MFKTDLQRFQFYDKYSRFNEVLMRKETWKETVKRATDYLFSLVELDEDEKQEIFDGIYNMDVMPSMRLIAMAGKAAIRNNACIYNCAYLPIVDLLAFSEVLNLCMSGVGVGFSVELDYVDGLPVIEKQLNEIDDRYESIQYQIQDSTDGWVSAFYAGLNAWYSGEDIEYDYSLIRPNGAILRTKGGRASGPKPLKELLEFSRNLILSKQGEKLSSVDVYDIVCKIGDCVIMGGVRRVAFICLFSYDDEEMLHVKDGDFWNDKPWRSNSNNSRVIERRLSYDEIRDLFLEMDDGSNGEPGIFSRFAANNTIPERRERARFGLNPCGEIFLREFEFCNLSSVICRHSDTKQSLINKVRLATLISTIQSTAIKFNGLRQEWSDNCKQERLCGVDLNGQMDCDEVRKPETLRMLREVAVETNREYADRFGIVRGAAITTVKPSGNSGVMLGTSSGIHPRWSRYYIRNVTVNEGTTLYKMMKRQGVPMKHYSGTKWLVGFYEKSPDNAIVRRDLSALDQLDYWKVVKLNYTEHNPSCTIYYKDNEKDDVIQWLFDNQEIVGGLSFFPSFDAVYENAPYVEITKEQYEQAEKVSIDFSTISEFESYDYMGNFEFACSAGQCDFKL